MNSFLTMSRGFDFKGLLIVKTLTVISANFDILRYLYSQLKMISAQINDVDDLTDKKPT